jgi:hypothetical protein
VRIGQESWLPLLGFFRERLMAEETIARSRAFRIRARRCGMVEAVRDHWLIVGAVVVLVLAVVMWWRAR